jgi:hypothetical protein
MKNKEHTLGSSGPLAVFGEQLIANGYAIVPIAVGKKSPNFNGWEKSRATNSLLREWVGDGHLRSGVGVLTKDTPAVDIDVRDEDFANECEEKAIEIFGAAPSRIGMAPKRLLVYRTNEPFKKLKSKKFKTPDPINDDEWEEHQIEILCDGQQFVAYHTHPDTNRPYVWPNERVTEDGETIKAGGVLTIPQRKLTVITQEQCQEYIDWFNERCEEKGWALARKELNHREAQRGEIEMSEWAEYTDKVEDLTDEELRELLMLVPGNDDYHRWVDVGMALYHQYEGSKEGFELWCEWSEVGYPDFEMDDCKAKWYERNFAVKGKHRAPITFKSILEWAHEAERDLRNAKYLEMIAKFEKVRDLGEWDALKKEMNNTPMPAYLRESVVNLAKKQLEKVNGGAKTSVVHVRKELEYKVGDHKMPKWVKPWVYDSSDDRFYDTARKRSTSKQGFDAEFNRMAITPRDEADGKQFPSNSASDLALTVFKIPVVDGRRYAPGEDKVFTEEGGAKFANTYPEHELPDMPESYADMRPAEKLAIARVKNHIRHLLADKRERGILADWLSWIARNPSQRINWSILLQGTEGDGKSFFGEMMRMVLGHSNVKSITGTILETPFTGWAAGCVLACVEEVRMVGENRYAILNKIKPNITNKYVDVHRKGKDVVNEPNTVNYLMFTNYKDALPLEKDGRRYCVLFSKWQRKPDLDRFIDENPDYYRNLYDAIYDHPGAIRFWLVHRDLDDEFNARGAAPDTNARREMIQKAVPEFINNTRDLIADRVHPLVSEELLSTLVLKRELLHAGHDAPQPKGMVAMLERESWEHVGRVKVEGEMHSIYSLDARQWIVVREQDDAGNLLDFRPDAEKIRVHVKKNTVNPFDDEEL